jgi:hypothetical protein
MQQIVYFLIYFFNSVRLKKKKKWLMGQPCAQAPVLFLQASVR